MADDTDLIEAVRALVAPPLTEGPLPERVETLNALRALLHELSPFRSEPVDTVTWVPMESVQANDYNPNSVAPPEMELLRLSIAADGYTQPIVTMGEGDGTRTVIDGFHRNRVGRECDDVRERVMGYLPVVQIRDDRQDRGDRMASTIRHNRARGKHQVIAMSDIVMDLKRRNWSDEKIGRELGMDPDEVLRLAQITGLAEAFKDREFSQAWEHTGALIDAAEPVEDEGGTDLNLEWMNQVAAETHPAGWRDRTENSSVLHREDGGHAGMVQRSRFRDEWFWYAYTQPMQEGRAPTREAAKATVEATVRSHA